MRKIGGIIFCIMLLAGCSSTSEKTIETNCVPTTVFGFLPSPEKEKPIVTTPAEEIPSFKENTAYREINGFPDYVIGVGDTLTITMLKATTQESMDVKVPHTGLISFSFLDNHPVAGKTIIEVADEITHYLEKYVKKPRITVAMKQYNSKKVYFIGEISKVEGLPQSGPGVYSLTGKTTLLNMLISIGGYTTKADLSRLEITRGGKVYTFNMNKVLTGEGQDVILEKDDRIIIPQFHAYVEEQTIKMRVYVLGEVKWPRLIESKTSLTVLEALSQAQGLTSMAAKSKARIVRGDIRNPKVIPLDLKQLIDKSNMKINIALEDGDVIYVPTTLLGRFGNTFNQVMPILNAFTYPAIYRDLYTTGGIGVFDTGLRPTGGGKGSEVTTETILSR